MAKRCEQCGITLASHLVGDLCEVCDPAWVPVPTSETYAVWIWASTIIGERHIGWIGKLNNQTHEQVRVEMAKASEKGRMIEVRNGSGEIVSLMRFVD